jgi:hypothetical protein
MFLRFLPSVFAFSFCSSLHPINTKSSINHHSHLARLVRAKTQRPTTSLTSLLRFQPYGSHLPMDATASTLSITRPFTPAMVTKSVPAPDFQFDISRVWSLIPDGRTGTRTATTDYQKTRCSLNVASRYIGLIALASFILQLR